ncbi:LacI family transcriptional regulator [Frondihabitans sp. PhB188]|uniref:LacI family DNA-binding transcriptional regulator n=1 Tax=Frondihabitans sp. PhB188 TaxID=2485200 RepID=UPI000F496DCA|nr:LacI family DNA-binding transcriptional regulator [Frondihabitans sp. PhB188]ROQ39749.1 LacI family transcriptional regulator [Frondihabitans sp. PhB188]
MSASGDPVSATPPGKATIRDVARLAGVSHSAVSKVIRNAYGVSPGMRERVTAAIDALDYRPSATARAMRGSGFTIGLEMPSDSNPFFNVLIGGAMAALADSPYQLVVAPAMSADALEFRALEALADRQVDGLVAISPLVGTAWLARLSRQMPIVMLGRHDESAAYDTLASDDALGTRLVMEHLRDLGHRRIAHLTHGAAVTAAGSLTPHAVRYEAYHAAMAAAGLDRSARVIRTGANDDEAYATTMTLLRDARQSGDELPTAIFAGNDSIALGVQRAILDSGLTHDDISLASYDGIPMTAHPAVSLTTVDQRGHEMGATAVTLLLERLAGRTESKQLLIEPRLRVGTSTRPPRS